MRDDEHTDAGTTAPAGRTAITAREARVLQSMAQGLSCRETARALGISEATVRKHRSNMLGKLSLRNAAELLAHARRAGWVSAAGSRHFRRALRTGEGSDGTGGGRPHQQGSRPPAGDQ